MFNFFRKFRLEVFKKDKFKKYLFYALGEIALVVIGILIALQVNNWNERAKEREVQINYLKNLQTDIQRDIRLIDGIILNRVDRKIEGLNLAKDYAQGHLIVKDTLEFLLKASDGAVFANGIDFFANQTYDEMIL